jgi:hypothetical protein
VEACGVDKVFWVNARVGLLYGFRANFLCDDGFLCNEIQPVRISPRPKLTAAAAFVSMTNSCVTLLNLSEK